MICPHCASAYRAGFNRCPDCDIDLVEPSSPSPLPLKAQGRLKPVLWTTRIEQAYTTMGLLENHGIPTFLENEHGAFMTGGIPNPATPFIVCVPEEQEVDALTVLKDAVSEEVLQLPADSGKTADPRWQSRFLWLLATPLVVISLPLHPASPFQQGEHWTAMAWAALAVSLLLCLHARKTFSTVPGWVALACFLSGAFVAIPLSGVFEGLLGRGRTINISMICLTAPVVEEAMKALGLWIVVGIRRSWRNNPWTWVMGGLASGAGFGVIENIGYYSHFEWSGTPSYDFIFRSGALMHMAATGFMGICMARWKRRCKSVPMGAVVGLPVAMAIHALWNTLASVGLAHLLPILLILSVAGVIALLRQTERIGSEPPVPPQKPSPISEQHG